MFKKANVLLALVFAMLIAPAAFAQTPITSCGTTILTSGVYQVASDLSYTGGPTGNCITVTVSDVTVDLGGFTISGPGNLPLSNGVQLGTGTDSISIVNGSITGFGNAINCSSNETVFNNLTLTGNVAGIFMRGAGEDRIVNSTLSNNSQEGIFAINGFNALVAGDTISNNGIYGIWIQVNGLLLIDNNTLANNRIAGIYIGCSMTGPGGPCITKNPHTPTLNNVFNNTISGGSYGIVVDSTSSNNRILKNNVGGTSIDDMFDANATCATDTWYQDAFRSSNQSCIQ